MKPFANTLLHSSCAAARGGPKHAPPGGAEAIDDAAIERQLGSDDGEIDRGALGEREQRLGIERHRSAASLATAAMPRLPGAQKSGGHARLAREPPREGVFAAAAAGNQDPHECR